MSFITTLTGIADAFGEKPLPTIWAYVRVSDDTHEDNESPDVQRTAILGYCQRSGIPEPRIVYEKASAAKPLFTVRLPGMKPEEVPAASPRPLLSSLIAKLCERDQSKLCEQDRSKLLIWKLDRLSRVAAEQDMLFSFFERHAITLGVAYASESFLADSAASADPVRVLMRQVLGSFAQYERHLIQMRMKLGTQNKYARGGWIGGNKPYGYMVVNHDLTIDPQKAPIVRLIFSLVDGAKMTLNEVARYLRENGHGAKIWYKGKVHRVIKNRAIYRGILTDPTGVAHDRPDLRILEDPVATIAPDDAAPADQAEGDALPEPELELP